MEMKFHCRQFREYLIASFFAIIVQLHAMKWHKRKQPLRAIPRNGIPIGNPSLVYYHQNKTKLQNFPVVLFPNLNLRNLNMFTKIKNILFKKKFEENLSREFMSHNRTYNKQTEITTLYIYLVTQSQHGLLPEYQQQNSIFEPSKTDIFISYHCFVASEFCVVIVESPFYISLRADYANLFTIKDMLILSIFHFFTIIIEFSDDNYS